MSKYQPTVTRTTMLAIGRKASRAKSLRGAIRILSNFAETLPAAKRGNWRYSIEALIDGLRSAEKTRSHKGCRYKIIKLDGNKKLPFACFSSMAIIDCPGAGECAKWCYSLTGWRNPGAYCRALQNTILLRHAPDIVESAWHAIPEKVREFRLYVDGDFESVERVAFWMRLIAARPSIMVYGYSKSWATLLEFHHNCGSFPDNYCFNLSSGSKYPASYETALRAIRTDGGLPLVRGSFIAVPIDGKDLPKGAARYAMPEYHQRVRAALIEQTGSKGISCPGDCGNCPSAIDGPKRTSSRHMCGDLKLHDVTIAIGIH